MYEHTVHFKLKPALSLYSGLVLSDDCYVLVQLSTADAFSSSFLKPRFSKAHNMLFDYWK